MRRFSKQFFITTLLLLVLIPSFVQAQNGIVTNVQTQLALRTGAGTEWRRLETMPVGLVVALDGRTESGLWVRGITSGGSVGWMAGRFMSASSAEIFSLPVIFREDPLTVSQPTQDIPIAAAPAANPEQPAAPAAPPSAPASTSTGNASTTATTNVNMRSGPDTSYRRVDGLSAGQPINIDGRDSSGRWVRGINSNSSVGWVASRYVSLPFDQVTALPVVAIETPFGLAAPAGAAPAAPAPSTAGSTTVITANVPNTAPVSGFEHGGQVRDFGEGAANWMRAAGMTWVKRQVIYNLGSDPGSQAGIINDAHARGFRILLSVIGHPSDLNHPGYFEQYAGFVGGLAAHGADAIEVWNEMNIDREWPAGQINPAHYVQLLAPSYHAIKGGNPNTLVISGAPAPTGFFGGCHGGGCDDAPYVAGMAAAGAGNVMDCIGIHYNEGIISPNQTSGDPRGGHYTRYFWGMVNAYQGAFGGSKPLCFTEIGYLTPEGYGALPGSFAWAGGTSVGQQALWLDQALNLARGSGRVRLFIVWNIDFTGVFGADPMGGYAIIRPDGSCPACNALGS